MYAVLVFFAFLACASGHHLGYNYKPKIDPTMNWRIVGGQDASPNQFPYIVSLRNTGGKHFCAGSIINQVSILSAAHCVTNAGVNDISAVVGSITLDAGGTPYSLSSIITHAGYIPFLFLNDIAVLNVASAIQFGVGVNSIPMGGGVVGSTSVVLSGWGRTVTGGAIPNDLQFLNLQTINNTQCQSAWWPVNIVSSIICTATQVGQGTCYGDSGGPLTANGQQIGIVSGPLTWGLPCGIGLPDVFTRLSSHVGWINNNTSS